MAWTRPEGWTQSDGLVSSSDMNRELPPAPIMRFFEWDYDADSVVEYARDGECNECGACCSVLIKFAPYPTGQGQLNPILGWDSRNGEFINARKGKITEVRVGGKSRYFYDITITDEPERCAMLTDDNRCRVHLGKRLLSRAWPITPDQVAAFKDCSYTFREIGRWKISEVESQSS
jgi:hypothetical protein